jgi:MinD-like ATPase involved in chromosome partitioning or flagellar assembly
MSPPPVDYIRTDDLHTGPRTPRSHGARRLIYRATRGKINLGPPPNEQHQQELQRQARTALRGNYRILVVGKGGVGKTTIAAGVGSTLAQLRNDDRVVALDADTAFGKPGPGIDRAAVDSYRELVTDPQLHTFADIRSHLGTNTGCSSCPATPQPAHQLTPHLYYQALARLDRYFAVTIVDCGATMDFPVIRAAAPDRNAAIVVTAPWADGVSTGHQSLHWLAEYGTRDLVRKHHRRRQQIRRKRRRQNNGSCHPKLRQHRVSRVRNAVRSSPAPQRRHRPQPRDERIHTPPVPRNRRRTGPQLRRQPPPSPKKPAAPPRRSHQPITHAPRCRSLLSASNFLAIRSKPVRPSASVVGPLRGRSGARKLTS